MSEPIVLKVNQSSKIYITKRYNKEINYYEFVVRLKDDAKSFDNEIGVLDLKYGNFMYTCNNDTQDLGVPHDALKVLSEYIEKNLEE